MGRPREGEPKTKMLALRFTEEDKALMDRLAARLTGGNLTALLELSMRLLGHPGEEERTSSTLGLGGREAWQRLPQALDAWALALQEGSLRLEDKLGKQDWGMIADVCNGTMFMGVGTSPGRILAMEIYDGHRLNGTGQKWYERKANAEVSRLVSTLDGLDYAEAWAVIVATQWFWEHCEIGMEIEWWKPTVRYEHEKAQITSSCREDANK